MRIANMIRTGRPIFCLSDAQIATEREEIRSWAVRSVSIDAAPVVSFSMDVAPKDIWTSCDFQCVAPSFEHLIYEFSRAGKKFCVVQRARRLVEGGWEAKAYILVFDERLVCMGSYSFSVLADGSMGKSFIDEYEWFLPSNDSRVFNWQRVIQSVAGIAHLTQTFLNCKNVALKQVSEPKLERAFRRKYGVDMIRLHTIDIEPMKKVIRTEGGEKTDIKQALHICRGHFKDFRERGLFGKENLKGLFWVDSHARGSRENGGEINSDYAVNAP